MTDEVPVEQGNEPMSVAEEVAVAYRAEFRRLLVAGILVAVVIIGLGVLVVYGFDQVPGMSAPSSAG